jgi:hypothetical protein
MFGELEEYHHVYAEIKAATEWAVLIEVDTEEYWIPKSCIEDGHREFEKGDEETISVKRWKAEEVGLA